MVANKPSCKYNVGDLIDFRNRNFLIVEVENGYVNKNIYVYKLMLLGTSRTTSWFAVDVDTNSRLII
jgi:hypothetical protein